MFSLYMFKTYTRFKQFTGMLKFNFIKNDAKNILFLTIYFFQVCVASAPPRYAAVVYATVNIRKLK